MQHRSMSLRQVGAVAALVAFAGLAALSAAGPASAAGQFDGVYSGRPMPVAGSNPSCFAVARRVRVVNNHFNAILFYAEFSLDVAPDGSFSGASMQTHNPNPRGGGRTVTLRGRIGGGAMTMNYGTSVCQFHGEFTKG